MTRYKIYTPTRRYLPAFMIQVFVILILPSTGMNARDSVIHSASWHYQNENLNYKLQYRTPGLLYLYCNDTVLSIHSNDSRKFAELSASLFAKTTIINKSDTSVSSAPIIDIAIEYTPGTEDERLEMKKTIYRQPSYTYSPEYLALEYLVDDIVAPYLYTEEGIWSPGAVENRPEYIGGNAALLRYFAENLRWPPKLADICMGGGTVLKIEITADGSIGKLKVLRTPHEAIGGECMRVMQTLPEKCFKPATRKGIAVPCWYTFRITINTQNP